MKLLWNVLWLFAFCVFLVPDLSPAEVLTNDTIITMVKAGIGEELIISKIKNSQSQFDLSTNGILKLKKEGVGDPIIKAMMEAPPASSAAAGTPGKTEAIALYRQGKAVEAVAAFDKLLAEKPNDDGLNIWKALALLEQARGMRESNSSGYKPLVVNAYAILKPLGSRQAANADWNFAMAKAFWLNDRPTWARRAAMKALDLRSNFAEPHLLLGEMAYEDGVTPAADPRDPRGDSARRQNALASHKAYETALAMADLPSDLRAEALYKLGLVSAGLENKRGVARDYWEKAAAADPASRYGKMAQEQLRVVPAK